MGGIAPENYVSFTSNDAYLRGYELILLTDGCAAIDPKAHRAALAQMQRLLHARVSQCSDLAFSRKAGRMQVRGRE